MKVTQDIPSMAELGEELAKEDPDWCMSCNDDVYRKNWSDVQIGNWAIEQMSRGLAVGVIEDTEEE